MDRIDSSSVADRSESKSVEVEQKDLAFHKMADESRIGIIPEASKGKNIVEPREIEITPLSQFKDEGLSENTSNLWRRDKDGQTRDSGDKRKEGDVVQASNGDTITIGGPDGKFKIVDAQGNEVEISGKGTRFGDDLPVEYPLSNGAVYRSRGGWNHQESIVYPNGDRIEFTDGGKLTETTIDGKTTKY